MSTPTKTILSYTVPLCIFLSAFCFFLRAEAQTATTTEGAGQRRAGSEERQQKLEERVENREAQLAERQASTTARIEERQASSSERIEERQTLRTERQAALKEVRQQRVLNLSANISNRMEAAIARLYDIIGRFEQRVEKLKTAGVDTATTEAKIREASQALAEARSTLTTIDTEVYDATTSTEPQNNWAAVRSTYQEAGQHIRTSHQALREAVILLKAAIIAADLERPSVTAEGTATTTE